MIPYWLSFILPALLSLVSIQRKSSHFIWWFLFVAFVVFVGLSHKVGGDWFHYLAMYEDAAYFPFLEYITQMDIGYAVINWISYQLDGDIYLVNFISAIIFFIGLIIFCRAQPLPFLAFTVAVPYLITVVSMGYTRQGIAIGLVMLALKYLSFNDVKRFLFYLVIAALFHKSAIILFPLAIFYKKQGRNWRIFGVGVFGIVMLDQFLGNHYEAFLEHYVDAGMTSDGGLIRVLMNLLPSILLFMNYKKIKKQWSDYRIWMLMAFATIIMVPLVTISSTAIDRIALYIIPLQLVVFSRLPMMVSKKKGRSYIFLTIVFYAVVFFVWLNFSNFSYTWLPYQNFLLLDLFQ